MKLRPAFLVIRSLCRCQGESDSGLTACHKDRTFLGRIGDVLLFSGDYSGVMVLPADYLL